MGRIKKETEQAKHHKAYAKEFRERVTPIINKYTTGATFGKYHDKNPKSKSKALLNAKH